MIRFLSHVFKYLDRFYVKRLSLPELKEVGDQNFHEIVFNAVKRDVRAAVLEMVRKEREGEQIDRKLIKQVVEIFVEMGSSRTGLEVRTTAAQSAHRPRAPLHPAPHRSAPPPAPHRSASPALSRCTSPTSRSSCSPPPPTSTRASLRSGPRRTRSPTTW